MAPISTQVISFSSLTCCMYAIMLGSTAPYSNHLRCFQNVTISLHRSSGNLRNKILLQQRDAKGLVGQRSPHRFEHCTVVTWCSNNASQCSLSYASIRLTREAQHTTNVPTAYSRQTSTSQNWCVFISRNVDNNGSFAFVCERIFSCCRLHASAQSHHKFSTLRGDV